MTLITTWMRVVRRLGGMEKGVLVLESDIWFWILPSYLVNKVTLNDWTHCLCFHICWMDIVIAAPPGSQLILRTRAMAQEIGPCEATILCPTSRGKSLRDPGLQAVFLWWPHVYWRITTVCFSDRHCSATHPEKHLLWGGKDPYLPVGSGEAAHPSTSSLRGRAP